MDVGENKEFNKALYDFAFDVAGGAAIRHLVDLGYTVPEIRDKLSYPLSEKQIGQTVLKYLTESGVILVKEPDGSEIKKKSRYITCKGEYGRTYFKQVNEEQQSVDKNDYIKCDFGRRLYKDRDGFEKELTVLEKRDRDYVLGIPWPLSPVWHIKNERMLRIVDKCGSQGT